MCTVRTRNNGNRFIEQYEWTIGVCITVQIGECGTFMDVQIGERGKQRVKQIWIIRFRELIMQSFVCRTL